MSLSKNEKELLRRLGLGKENAKTTKEIIRGLPITERGAPLELGYPTNSKNGGMIWEHFQQNLNKAY